MWRRCVAAALVVVSVGCDASGEADAGTDGGRTADAGVDAGLDAGSAPDAGPARDVDGCLIATVGAWRAVGSDDVSITYAAPLEPRIDGLAHELTLTFNRYGMASYVGTFDLASGQDTNFGSCARCVMSFHVTSPDRGYFADRGALTLGASPFTRRLDAALANVRLVEVTIEPMDFVPTSVPVPGGACVAIADASVAQTFPPDGWRCDAGDYRDGVTCHCGCGAFDPDCRDACDPLDDPDCVPFEPLPELPRTGCMPGEICGVDGECLAGCDHAGRVGCASGLCGFGVEGDRCYSGAPGDRIDSAAIGEACGTGNLFCGESGGFLDGMCDDLDGYLCRRVCDEASDCDTGAGELCYTVFGDKGYCRPPPPLDG